MREPTPFEYLYRRHGAEILAILRRSIGTGQADDAFQDTMLRALRTYGNVTDASGSRAWLYAIARSVVIDAHRRRDARPPAASDAIGDPAPDESLSGWHQLESLTASLPHTERAAVVLRYGYDLGYDQIGAALGSTSDAARQATSSGVRRLRRQQLEEDEP
ncbi:MAG: RNA polymerase sigma factor [Gaiellales bacterium]